MYLLFGDTRLHRAARAGADGHADGPARLRCCAPRSAASARSPRRSRSRSGPPYLYYSRFAREDIYIACITLALLAVTFRFLERPRRHQPALIGALLALSFATKESTFITVFVAGTFFLVALARPGAPARLPRRADRAHGRGGRLGGVGVGARRRSRSSSRCCSPSSSPTPAGSGTASTTASRTGSRSTRPAAAARRSGTSTSSSCSPRSGRRCCSAPSARSRRCGGRRCCALFLIWDFVLSLARLLLGERALPLAGAAPAAAAAAARRLRRAGDLGRARALDRQARPRRRARSASLYVGYTSWWANVENGADPREFLVTTQSAEEVKGVRDEVDAVADARAARGPRREHPVDSAEGATFPWAWYFRDLAAGYLDLTDADELPRDTDVAILTEANRDRLLGRARRLRRPPLPVPRLVGARLRRDVAGRLVALVHASARRGTRPAACRSGSTCARARELSARVAPRHRVPLVRVEYTRARRARAHFATPPSPYSVRSSGPTTT